MRALLAVRVLLPSAAIVLLGIRCSDDGSPTSPGNANGNVSNTSFVAEASFSSEVSVANQSQLTLRGINSGILISGRSDSSSVLINAVRRVKSESASDARSNLARLEVRVTDLGNEVLVETIQPQASGGRSFEVDYTITLPRTLEVSVTNVNGAVTVEDITAHVAVVNTNGEVDLRSVSGGATVESVNGRIEANAALPRAGRVELSLVNGGVELEIPRNTSAEFSASTSNGTVTLSNLTLANETATPTSRKGTLGGGEGTIILSSVNGSITARGF